MKKRKLPYESPTVDFIPMVLGGLVCTSPVDVENEEYDPFNDLYSD